MKTVRPGPSMAILSYPVPFFLVEGLAEPVEDRYPGSSFATGHALHFGVLAALG